MKLLAGLGDGCDIGWIEVGQDLVQDLWGEVEQLHLLCDCDRM